MDKKYHRGGGEVVIPNKDIQPSSLTHFISIIQNLPVYAYCDPALPVGWIEGEEVYMVKTNKPDIWKKVSGSYYYFKPKSYRRIWIEPKQGQPHKCQYCGAMTTQHDDQCWNNPKNFKQNQPDFQREAEELYPDVEKQGISAFVNTKIQRAAHIKARQMSAGEVEELRRENDRLKADNMTHEYNEAEAQRFAPEYERQIREDEANKWREQVRKLREVLGKLREGLIESGLIFAHLEDFTHGKEGEVITHQRGKIKQLLNETSGKLYKMSPQEQYLQETGAKTIWKIPNHTHTDEYSEWLKNYVKTSDSLAAKMVRQFANGISKDAGSTDR